MLTTVLFGLLSLCLASSTASSSTQPNIVFFLVDDQDVMLNSLDAMQKTRELFTENGLKFSNGFSSTPVCCVSRSSILLGRYVHNHLAQNNTVAGNCYSDEWIATEEQYAYNNYLHKAGYKTYYSGKYLNNYGKGSDGSGRTYETIPAGWDGWYTLCGDAKFYSYTLSNNGVEESHGTDYETDYFPKLQKEHALSFLDEIANDADNGEENPFLMVLATPAAHKPWTPAPEYEYIVDDESMKAPRTISWNYMENSDKGAVIQSLDEMDDDLISQSDEIYRRRHAILLTVDDMISEVYSKLESMDKLDNTYFIYTADHGFHVGQFGMTFGKRLLYEPDIRVPFYISGPTVKKNGITSAMALNIDIAPTIIELALGSDSIPDNMDGRSLVEFFDLTDDEEEALSQQKQVFLVEYNGESPPYDPEDDSAAAGWAFNQQRGFQGQKGERGAAQGGQAGQAAQGGQGKLSQSNKGQMSRSLLGESRPANLWIMNCESQVEGLDGMNCDTWNNTYKCVRVIDGLKEDEDALTSDSTTWETTMSSNVKGEIYCSYTCFDAYYKEAACMENSVEELGEYYDLDYDTWQTTNQMSSLTSGIKSEYQSILNLLKSCSGESCRTLRTTTSTWYKRNIMKANDEIDQFETGTDSLTRHMSEKSYVVVGVILLVGLVIAYVLYNHIMSQLMKKERQHKYERVATRPNYGSNSANVEKPTQQL